MKVEMDRPYFALAVIFARWHVNSYVNLVRILVPAWHRCLADTSNARRRRFGVGVEVRVFSAGFVQIEMWREVGNVCVVEFDERGIEALKNRWVQGIVDGRVAQDVLHLASGRRACLRASRENDVCGDGGHNSQVTFTISRCAARVLP